MPKYYQMEDFDIIDGKKVEMILVFTTKEEVMHLRRQWNARTKPWLGRSSPLTP